jgi:hypothetical protein
MAGAGALTGSKTNTGATTGRLDCNGDRERLQSFLLLLNGLLPLHRAWSSKKERSRDLRDTVFVCG